MKLLFELRCARYSMNTNALVAHRNVSIVHVVRRFYWLALLGTIARTSGACADA
jgi:hypothetical protein